MKWKDRLHGDEYHRASFRDALFYVKESDSSVGRRNVLHQYPFKDIPYLEDLGLDADEFTITGYVIQNSSNSYDYFKDRDALISELKKKGSGTLVHPFLGQYIVGLKGKAKIKESFEKGGMAQFSMTFVIAGKNIAPITDVDNITAVDSIVQESEYYLRDNFTDKFLTSDDFVASQYGGTTRKISAVKQSKPKQISDFTAFCNKLTGKLSYAKGTIKSSFNDVITKIDDSVSNITNVIDAGCSLGSQIIDTINSVLLLIGIPNPIINGVIGRCSGRFRTNPINLPGNNVPQKLGTSVVKSIMEAVDFDNDLEDVEITGLSTAVTNVNRIYMIYLIKIQIIMVAMRIAVRINYESYDDAKEIMELITDSIDAESENIGDYSASTEYIDYGINLNLDDSYTILQNICGSFVTAMVNIGADLAKIVDYTVPPAVISTLTLAYEKYNDVNREQEILDRNYPVVDHPGFLPQGKTIEILDV